jgi:hypothetical protein
LSAIATQKRIAVSNNKSLVKGISNMSNDPKKFYDKDPNRKVANRSRYEGGNNSSTTETNVEKHGSPRAERIAQGGSGGADGLTTGCEKTFGFGRSGGGNSSNGDAGGFEKHGQYLKGEGVEYVDSLNGRGGAKHTKVPLSNLVAGHDRSSTGNDDRGGREPSCSKRATRLDMSVERFHK